MRKSIKGLSETFVVSDTHFFHSNIIKYCSRPFLTIEEMNESLILNWNTKVRRNDEVYHLGDFSFDNVSKEKSESILSRLNGIKILIEGNHDNREIKKSKHWNQVKESLSLSCEEKVFLLSHFPKSSWKRLAKGVYHLHGHVHCNQYTYFPHYKQRRLDVGVDFWNYHPVSLQDCLDKMFELETFLEQNSIYSNFF